MCVLVVYWVIDKVRFGFGFEVRYKILVFCMFVYVFGRGDVKISSAERVKQLYILTYGGRIKGRKGGKCFAAGEKNHIICQVYWRVHPSLATQVPALYSISQRVAQAD
ncbi:hypothetical protein M747DRAFT_309937 [Aspergillus niger ATCC 13496]|uniref:Uncharacterized protein n=1 Tax=Aspergillus niger ATCC 13496 TaxID=1353008 RepID=A0A370BN44_ASPNG|nr:hypothetical protein M747DRAFT_309937 [Aspergillus niger ATCC 13496]